MRTCSTAEEYLHAGRIIRDGQHFAHPDYSRIPWTWSALLSEEMKPERLMLMMSKSLHMMATNSRWVLGIAQF